MVSLPGLPPAKTIRVATPFRSIDELVAAYWPFCEPGTCFVPAPQQRPVGLSASFALLLYDGRPALSGRCTVDAAWEPDDPTCPYGRPGVRLRIRSFARGSAAVFDRLLARRADHLTDRVAAPEPIVDGDATARNAFEPAYSTTPTVAIAPLAARERATVLGIAPTRPPAAPIASPGAPGARSRRVLRVCGGAIGPLWICSEPTRVPRGLFARLRDAVVAWWRRRRHRAAAARGTVSTSAIRFERVPATRVR